MRRLIPLATVALLAGCGREPPRPSPLSVAPAPAPAPAPVATPAARPPWVAHKVVTDAVAVPGGRLHTVKAGETGIAIARAYGVPWSQVVAANHLAPPYTLEIGDRLLLPSKVAVAAQTPAERARAFNIDIDDLITGAEPAGGGGTSARPPAPRPAASAAARAAQPPRPSPPRAAPLPAAPLPTLAGPAPTFAWPLEGRVLSGFGAKPGGRFNDGVNLKASVGTPVRAAADGVVAYAGDAVAGFGNLVLVKHADGWVSAYGHNETLLVARGQKVAKGDIIARSGASGAVDEPQLHFELRRGRTPSDPLTLLPHRDDGTRLH